MRSHVRATLGLVVAGLWAAPAAAWMPQTMSLGRRAALGRVAPLVPATWALLRPREAGAQAGLPLPTPFLSGTKGVGSGLVGKWSLSQKVSNVGDSGEFTLELFKSGEARILGGAAGDLFSASDWKVVDAGGEKRRLSFEMDFGQDVVEYVGVTSKEQPNKLVGTIYYAGGGFDKVGTFSATKDM